MSKKHIGSSFEDFLKEEDTFEETTTQAVKRARQEAPKEPPKGNGENRRADVGTFLNQGAESNHSGRGLELIIIDEFRRRNVPARPYKDNDSDDIFDTRVLLTDAPYLNCYNRLAPIWKTGRRRSYSKSEFLYRAPDIQIRIECKRQDRPGSVDEKFPFLIKNAIECMPEEYIWFVIDGLGARENAMLWLRRESASIHEKTIRVYNLIEARQAIKNLLIKGVA